MNFYRLRRTLQRLRRGLGMSPTVIHFKARQALALRLERLMGSLPRTERRIHDSWARKDPALLAQSMRFDQTLLIRQHGVAALRKVLRQTPHLQFELRRSYDELQCGEIRIFGRLFRHGANPALWPWNRDWTCGHSWPLQHHLAYYHYEFGKLKPYDVKHPWEFSRLNFMMRPALLALADGTPEFWILADAILAAFQAANPYGYSVNWYPMECSMRGINLALLAQMAAQDQSPEAARFLVRCLELCELHGHFIWRNLEFTQVRGNHYAANITALALLGTTLKHHVSSGQMWLDYASKTLEPEILEQFLPDGVQIEKSVPYHRLVSQLFLLASLALDRSGKPMGPLSRERLRQGLCYLRCCVRPDGLSPAWGDNDDARACWFDEANTRDHRLLLNFSGSYFDDASLIVNDELPLESALLLESCEQARGTHRAGMHFFEAGGMLSYQGEQDFLFVDMGEVGLRGQGGHGHLDATSFEFFMHGNLLVVDPGSYVYTGDLESRRSFRSSASHNVVMIDSNEIATLPTHSWSLGREADPIEVKARFEKGVVEIEARHCGFERLESPVRYRRQIRYEPAASRFEVTEEFDGNSSHTVDLHLHLAAGVFAATNGENAVRLKSGDEIFNLQIPSSASVEIMDGWISHAYFQKTKASVLHLRWNLPVGESKYCWSIVAQPDSAR